MKESSTNRTIIDPHERENEDRNSLRRWFRQELGRDGGAVRGVWFAGDVRGAGESGGVRATISGGRFYAVERVDVARACHSSARLYAREPAEHELCRCDR